MILTMSVRQNMRTAMPTRILGRYAARSFLMRFAGILIGLVAILQLLDLMNVSDDILAARGAGTLQILRYLTLRTPQLIAQFIPFTALLATLLTLATLSQHSEIIIMKSAGLSAHKILMPLGLAAAGIALFHLLFIELAVVRATAELEYWRDKAFAVDAGSPPEYSSQAQLVEGNNAILVESVRMEADGLTYLDKISIYERDASKHLTFIVRADFATYIHGRWTLYDVRRFNIAKQTTEYFETAPWATGIPPSEFRAMAVRPERVNLFQLISAIRHLSASGQSVTTLVASLWHKLAVPMATLLMPLLGAVTGFGIHRAGTLFARAAIGMALGFSYFVADNFMFAMGQFGVTPPFIAAFGPVVMFATLGFAVLFYTEE